MSNSNPNVPHGTDWQCLMNYKFNLQREGRRLDKKIIAHELEIKEDTFQRHLNGTIQSNGDFVRDLTRAVLKHYPSELEFIEFFLPSGFRIVHEKEIQDGKNEHQIVEVSILSGKVQEIVEQAYADGKIDKAESKSISRKVANLQHVLTEINEKIKGEIA